MTKLLTIRNFFSVAVFAIAVSVCALSNSNVFGQTSSADKTETKAAESTEETTDKDPYGYNELPEVGKNIGVDSKNGNFIPKDLTFTDEQNRFVDMGRYFDGDQPVMLSFNYSNCPKLCSVQLENMMWALREVDFKIGEDFRMVSVSIDPNEQTSRARQTKAVYTDIYNQEGAENSIHFLTGKRKNIKKLADVCGFRYKYVKEQKLFSHPPVFILVSPEGKIVRYIHGLDYEPDTIEKALIESAAGKIGSPINLLSYGLGCFLYDPSTGKYSFQAMAIMRIGGLVTVVLLLVTLIPYWWFRRGTDNNESDKKGMPVPTGSAS